MRENQSEELGVSARRKYEGHDNKKTRREGKENEVRRFKK
jgi:hypothetical protein